MSTPSLISLPKPQTAQLVCASSDIFSSHANSLVMTIITDKDWFKRDKIRRMHLLHTSMSIITYNFSTHSIDCLLCCGQINLKFSSFKLHIVIWDFSLYNNEIFHRKNILIFIYMVKGEHSLFPNSSISSNSNRMYTAENANGFGVKWTAIFPGVPKRLWDAAGLQQRSC